MLREALTQKKAQPFPEPPPSRTSSTSSVLSEPNQMSGRTPRSSRVAARTESSPAAADAQVVELTKENKDLEGANRAWSRYLPYV